MADVKNSISECIGNTPMLRLNKIQGANCKATILLKMESENPAKSVKDRLALSIIEENEKNGTLTPGKSVLIEATSGNTGVALAMLGAAKGYRTILVMPEQMSLERRCLFAAYGAELVLTPASKGLKGALFKAEALAAEIGADAFLTEQFATEFNAKVHRETTGPEIWKQTGGKVDILVSGIGTGGTATGCAQYFKDVNGKVKVVAVEPAESAVLSGSGPGPHKIQGMGAGFKPHTLDMTLMDEVRTVPSAVALELARRLPKEEGVLAGISAGAIVQAALDEAAVAENAGKTIVAIIPSYGERYLSSALFSELKDACAAHPVCSEEECSPPEGWTCKAMN
eukprot:TRINITY_DN1922_c0_g1_i4.p1 TRINITY_DN1922_c0_g1~~TRINITY_DN1922_c0_g1_i4.p1  ORF type:complete len:340 (+),score=182.81 TRINITY_DN1922_c0_g1_i4:60-1079(+)